MIIELRKFGSLLTSRQLGKEALAAISPQLPKDNNDNNEEIIVDFLDISTFSPSWGDEFLSPLQEKYRNNLLLKNTDNPSVKATIEILEETNKVRFQVD